MNPVSYFFERCLIVTITLKYDSKCIVSCIVLYWRYEWLFCIGWWNCVILRRHQLL